MELTVTEIYLFYTILYVFGVTDIPL